MSTKDILLGAAVLIERDGWTQGRNKSAKGEWCINGALQKVVILQTDEDFDRLLDAQNAVENVIGYSIIDWNDTVGRTKEEAVNVLREAAGVYR